MNSKDLIFLISGVVVFITVMYLVILMKTKSPIKHGNARCEKMLKELEEEPFNTTIGDDLYSAKNKKQ